MESKLGITRLKSKDLFESLEKKLPPDVLYNIYTFCNLNEKKKIREYLFKKHDIEILVVLLTISTISYFIGYLITRRFLGFFIVFNFLLGYLTISAVTLILTLLCLPFKSYFVARIS